MLQAALAAGTADRRAVFELFPRRLPEGRRYGVLAGVGRALDAIERFRFDAEILAVLREHAVVDEPTLEWLADYRFRGNIWGYAEGETYFPYAPLMTVESTFAEAVLLETVLLSVLNHDSAIASAASRMTWAAGSRPCIEMGSRRTHEEAAVASARAAYISGFVTTSNLAARQRSGSVWRWPAPTSGRSASTAATSACWPSRCATSSTRSARTAPGSSSPPTSTSTPSRRWPRHRSTATESARRWSPA